MPFAAAERLIQENCMFNALNAVMDNGDHCRAGTVAAQNARIMKPVFGLTGSKANCCRSCTS